MMRSQSQALTYRSMIRKLPASGIRIEVDNKKMSRDAYAKEVP